ncbi:hypothetical protein [Embleya sp. AB8]|uniref:hypothetical protein n=1 Tax=Embleya sp. AB8 TaxID=3156304 RepID=UPI003C78F748
MHFIGSIGAPGMAAILTLWLFLGTNGGGKIKPLGWGGAFGIGSFAGAAYNAGGSPWNIISDLVNDLVGFAFAAVPGLTMPAVAVCIVLWLAYRKLTPRRVGIWAIFFWYVASGAGGVWALFATQVSQLMQRFAVA